jgi:hypothetical protein
MADEDPSDPQSAGPGPFPTQSFQQPVQQHTMQPPNVVNNQATGGPQHFLHPSMPQADASNNFLAGLNSIVDPYDDPSLDADPFGLSASMHFPTQFSFDTR